LDANEFDVVGRHPCRRGDDVGSQRGRAILLNRAHKRSDTTADDEIDCVEDNKCFNNANNDRDNDGNDKHRGRHGRNGFDNEIDHDEDDNDKWFHSANNDLVENDDSHLCRAHRDGFNDGIAYDCDGYESCHGSDRCISRGINDSIRFVYTIAVDCNTAAVHRAASTGDSTEFTHGGNCNYNVYRSFGAAAAAA